MASVSPNIGIGEREADLAALCRKWFIRELALFGSALRDDFRPDSDIDIMVTFDPAHRPLDPDRMLALEDELAALFPGHRIDLVERRLIRNPFIRHQAITNRRVLYAA